MEWTVLLRPATDEENTAGLVVLLGEVAGKGPEIEVSRVAFVRRHAANPDVTFEQQLTVALDKAQLACDALNDYEAENARLADLAAAEARDRVREILGKPEVLPQ